MAALSRLNSFFRNLLRRDRVERDLDEELRAFVDMAADENRSAGLSDDEARRSALVELGGVEQVKESVRDVRAGAFADQLRQDGGYAVRMLRRNTGFTAVAVATLALGIGANTAIFTVVDTVVFRPLPYADPERLVKIWGTSAAEPIDNMSLPDFLDIRAQADVFERIAADDGSDFTFVAPDGSRVPMGGAMVTPDWLSTLGVRPVLGRAFLPEEAQAGRDRVIILTHAGWRSRFASSPTVVGQQLRAEGADYTIVGVLPPNVLRYGADFLKPLVQAEYNPLRSHQDLDVFARLKPGVTIEQARVQLDTIARRLEAEYPATNNGRRFRVVSLGKYYTSTPGRAIPGLVLMLGAVGLVLLIACANVANLLLSRAVTRGRECLIRAALGASRARLIRQMLVESVLLFLMGGTLGVLLARWSVDSLVAFAISGNYVPERMAVAVDARVLGFTLLTSLVAGVVFGLIPALHASRVDLNDGLRGSSQASTAGGRRTGASRALIVSEIAISLVLLVGSGLLLRSFLHLQSTGSGIDTENLLETAADGGRDFPSAVAFWQRTLDQVRQDPGVKFAAVTSRPPVYGSRHQKLAIEGYRGAVEEAAPQAGDILVSADYFRTMGIPLVKGRAFSERDNGGAPPVAIVSQSLAHRYFPNDEPIGKRISVLERSPMTCCTAAAPVEGVWREIVGVVADVRQGNLDEPLALTLYRPYTQIVEHDMYLMVRAASATAAPRIAANLGPQLRAAAPDAGWLDVQPMRHVISASDSIRVRRFVLILLGIFAGLALILAAVGTYGVVAYSVAERTREIGIRIALGASRPVVLKQVLGETMRLTVAGLVLGALAARLLTRFISTMLFGVTSNDPLTYAGVSCVLAAVALLAGYGPARRATRVDPLTALRQE